MSVRTATNGHAGAGWLLGNAILAELAKLLTLPAALVTAAAAVLLGGIVSWAQVAGPGGAPLPPAGAVLAAVPLVQACFVVLGVLPATHEHEGCQHRTSLTAVPSRGVFFAAKSIAAALALGLTAAGAVAAGLTAATLARQLGGAPVGGSGPDAGSPPQALVGAAAYLALIGLLAHAAAVLLRHLVPALVTTLVLVLILPPLVSFSEHARWLPSRAGALLYDPEADALLTSGTGTLVLAGWIVAVGGAALLTSRARDA